MAEQQNDKTEFGESSEAIEGHFPDRRTAQLAAQTALNNGFTVQLDGTTVKIRAAQSQPAGEAEGILAAYGATNIPGAHRTAEAAETKHVRAERGGTFELVKEELKIGHEPVVAGEVRIRKNVVKETVRIDVPVEREDLVIERLPVQRGAKDQSDIERPSDPLVEALSTRLRQMQPGEVVRIPIVEERVVVHKEPVVRDELVIGKRLVREVQHLSEKVRREVPAVDTRGDVRFAELEEKS